MLQIIIDDITELSTILQLSCLLTWVAFPITSQQPGRQYTDPSSTRAKFQFTWLTWLMIVAPKFRYELLNTIYVEQYHKL